MTIQFIETTEGLKAEHKNISPLLEKVFCPPQSITCETSRVYPDGSLYFLMEDEAGKQMWGLLTTVKPAGLKQLEDLFDACCAIKTPPDANQNDLGSTIYRFNSSKCQKEVLIRGISYGKYEELMEVTNIINGNLMPIK